MNYQDLKLIWDEQTEEPLFTIDQNAILASVEEKCSTIERGLRRTERYLIPASLFAGVPLVLQLFIDKEPSWISFGVGLLFVVKAFYTWVLLKKRQQQERSYEDAVIPSIEKAILQNKHHATLMKRWLFWFHLPAAILAIIGLIFFPPATSAWMWALFVVAVTYGLYDTPRYLKHEYHPEQQNLQSIRSHLLSTQS